MSAPYALNNQTGIWHTLQSGGVATGCGVDTSKHYAIWVDSDSVGYGKKCGKCFRSLAAGGDSE